jgi:hypothetical protein
VAAKECVGHPVLKAQPVALDLGGMDERSGQTEGQAKGGLHGTDN